MLGRPSMRRQIRVDAIAVSDAAIDDDTAAADGDAWIAPLTTPAYIRFFLPSAGGLYCRVEFPSATLLSRVPLSNADRRRAAAAVSVYQTRFCLFLW